MRADDEHSGLGAVDDHQDGEHGIGGRGAIRCAEAPARNSLGVPAPTSSRMISPRL